MRVSSRTVLKRLTDSIVNTIEQYIRDMVNAYFMKEVLPMVLIEGRCPDISSSRGEYRW